MTADIEGPVDVFHIRFEVVKQHALRKYCNADPMLYKDTSRTVANADIPDEDWEEVTSRATDSPWEQYRNLQRAAAEDLDFVRNVRLERMVSQPVWEPTLAPWEQ